MRKELLQQLRLLNQEEADAGFRKFLVHDPEATPHDPGELILVVGYKISSTDLIWKVTDDGTIAYSYRRFGVRRDRPQHRPKWEPVGMKTFRTPGESIQSSQFEDAGALAYQIAPVDFIVKEASDT